MTKPTTIYIVTTRGFCDDDVLAFATRESAEIEMMKMAQAIADEYEVDADEISADYDYSGAICSVSICDTSFRIDQTVLR